MRSRTEYRPKLRTPTWLRELRGLCLARSLQRELDDPPEGETLHMANVTEKAAKAVGKAKRAKAAIKGERGIFRRLHEEHGTVSALMKRVRASSDADKKRELFDTIRTELLAHARAEEKEFYSLLLSHPSTRELIEHSIDEHEQVEQLIDELMVRDTATIEWDETFDELVESVEDHVEDEENELFPRAKQVFSPDDLDAIEERFIRVKEAQLQQLS
jgi:hemerythrin superfamily protein